MECKVCGQDNPPEARFCANCGATLVARAKPPAPEAEPSPRTGLRKWFLIGGLAILLMVVIGYGVTFLFDGSRRVPPPPPPPPAPSPIPAPTPRPPEVIAPPITKGEVLFFEDFESGSRNWDLADGWHLEEIGDNTVLKGTGHNWAVLEDKAWDNYAFEARFKPVKGNIHFNYRRSEAAGDTRYFIGVSSGGIYLRKEIQDKIYRITQASLNLDERWHEIEIIGYGNAINVYLDDTLLIFYKDDDPILSGGIAFLTLDDSEFLIDDVKITETSGPAATTPTPAGPETVTFSDKNLESALRKALGKPPGEEITAAELAKLTELEADESSITDLSGLEYCASLTWLTLGENQISNIAPLENLNSLNVLELYENQISDISTLSNLTSLTKLELGKNQISDISSLENLTSLNVLELHENQIRDVSPLASLTNLTRLILHDNEISDISPLENLTSLTELGLGGNQISDISPLENLTSLTELVLDDNEIRDVSPLASLTKLTRLILHDNEISDISALASLTNLTVLHLEENGISDVSPLVQNSGLGEGDKVWLEDNNLDLSEGSEDMENIKKLEERGVEVYYD